MRILSFTLGILLGFFLAFVAVSATECGQTPTDHCTISRSTTFTPGVYQVENITITANNTVVDCNGASFTKPGAIPLFQVGGTHGVTIQNCRASAYGKVITNDQGQSVVNVLPVETLTIRDNTFANIGGIAVYLKYRPATNTTYEPPYPNIQIINNTITESIAALYLIGINNSIIEDNTLDVNGPPNFEGIYLAGSSHALVNRNTLTGGKIHAQRETGIDSLNATITENHISRSYVAIELREGADGAEVRRNIAEEVGLGMWIRSGNHYIRGNVFSGNELLDNGGNSGIIIDDISPGINTQNITIFLNLFENMSDPVYDGGNNNRWNDVIRIFNQNFTFGNFYQIFYRDNDTRRGQTCTDTNFDNICDNPFLFDMSKRDDFAMRSRSSTQGAGGGGDSPLVDPIAPFYINEVDQVHVIINASSPINIPLHYAVKDLQGQVDPRFVPVIGQPNEFIWDTDLLTAGNYTFLAVATDEINLNGGVPFEVHINDRDSDCRLYLPRVVNGCEIKGNTVFSPGTYLIPNGLRFAVNDAALDCNGAVLMNEPIFGNPPPPPGMSVVNRQNIEIHNCDVRNNQLGLLIQGSTNVLVNRSKFSNSIDEGVKIDNSQNVRLEENTVTSTSWGARLNNANTNHLVRNQINNNGYGQLRLEGTSSYNNITENNVSDLITNRPIDVGFLTNSNIIYRNNFQRYVNGPWDAGTNTIWTVNGEGNYWDHLQCINNNWDRICDSPFTFLRYGVDSAPFARPDGWKRSYPQFTVSNPTPRVGTPITFTMVDPDMAERPYIVVADLATGAIPLGDGRVINLAGTGVFYAVFFNPYSVGFTFSGTFDANGVAIITWNIPYIPQLHGWPIYFNIIPFDPTLPMPQTILTTYRSAGVVLQQ